MDAQFVTTQQPCSRHVYAKSILERLKSILVYSINGN